ncbi:MAG: ABC transporter ATP-binding protein [Candidatus Acidiferrales bacterium]
MPGDLALQLRGVRFRPDGTKTMVLDGIDLDVRPGEWVLVMGPSGSGKTTFALTLNGTVPHSITGQFEGEVLVDGLLTTETPVATMATHIGMVFQDPDGQIVHETVRDEVYFGLENLQRPREEVIERAHRALDKVGMLDLVDAEIMSLSGGQKQRVSLAAVLGLSPDIIVLDEPTANLDPQGMRDVFEVVEQVHKNDGVTVVMIEHHVDELVEKVDRVIVLEDGRVTLDGPPAKVFTEVAPMASQRGLWLPQVCELAQAVGVTTPSGSLPMNVTECVAALEPVLTKGPAPSTPVLATAQPLDLHPLLTVHDLRFAYRGASPTLKGVSLNLSRGAITAIVGPNGSGKTTLAKCITRINQPPPGSIFLERADITKMSQSDLTRQVGYVFQNPDHQFVTDRTFDELAYSLRVRKVPEDEVHERVMRMLQLMELDSREDESPFALSVGERRRLSVATMLILEQRLVILDEPTIGQDLARSEALFQILDGLCREQQTTMVFITHDMRLVADWCPRTIVMTDGTVRYDGSTDQVFDDRGLLAQAHLIAPPITRVTAELRARGHRVPEGTITVKRMHEYLTAPGKRSVRAAR